MVTESAVMIKSIVADALSPISLSEIDSMNLALINIESVAAEVEQQALECEAALEATVQPGDEEAVDPDDVVPTNWVPYTDADYFNSDDSMHLPDTNGQRKASFYKSIERKYNDKKDSFPPSSLRSLEGRWQNIKEQVSKFEGYFNITAVAVTLYNSLEPKPFTVLHCWEILRNQPKWTDLHEKAAHGANLPDTGPGDPDSESVPRDQDSFSVAGSKRPLGRDSSKAAKRALSSQSASQSMDEFAYLLSNMHVEKLSLIKAHNGDIGGKLDELIALDKMKIKLKKETVHMKRVQEDERIMAVDLSTRNPMQCVLYNSCSVTCLRAWRAIMKGHLPRNACHLS
ncbi:hypothetical protein BAE44_0019568 [Dichanthelium oligosanthes]|uniref:No apical meristem-associated C-terminal domain-containing protein n=1 Tax=Dichanthelium oligosanthes TaxID=888268 RepID=A0A1E5V2L8_9POAL|nr:hypothetical protein BAE44_0019568 [Dichanthelium oligosanthes]